MTAEVAIMNKYGVALAADSAVSIGGSGKVYNSAVKLFALTKKHPVGIMIFGNAHFMAVPWEVLIKKYRADELGDRSFKTIHQYAEHFLDFLRTTRIFPKSHEADYAAQYSWNTCTDLKKAWIEPELKKFFSSHKAGAKGSVVMRHLRKKISEWAVRELSMVRQSAGFAARDRAAFKRTHKSVVADALKASLAEFDGLNLPKTTTDKLVEIVFDRLFSNQIFLSDTGLVISGYGDDEIFPSNYHIRLEGRLRNNMLKCTGQKTDSIDSKNNAAIYPFAQREMVDTFMCGIDPHLRSAISNNLKAEFGKISSDTLPSLGISVSPATTQALNNALKDREAALKDALKNIEDRYFVKPVLNSVSALPLDELAAMAEALVNLTSFKRRVTIVPESVGGPIDVAVISKGDGFIWIKRKHYFDADLNHHYFRK